MVILRGWVFLMGEVPLYLADAHLGNAGPFVNGPALAFLNSPPLTLLHAHL